MFGVTVLPEWVQAEGVDAVLDRLQAAGVTAVATSPYVMEPVADGEGSREPPADGGAGAVRLLDRPLWGRRALFVRTAPSFAPDRDLYRETPYRPPEPDDLTAREGAVVARFIEAAKARGMTVHLQVQAAIPPGYRVQFGEPRAADQPLGPDDAPVPGRVDANTTLASPAVLAYGRALLADLARAYPQVDAVRIDWPEYPPYHFGALFFDFSPHALGLAEAQGIDVARMRRDMLAVRRFLLTRLDDRHLDVLGSEAAADLLDAACERLPGLADMLALKRRLSCDLLAAYRAALPERIGLVPQAFPPPFHLVSGFDFAAAGRSAEAVGVKLYTMHWPMILRNWADAMLAGNPGLSADRLAAALVALGDTGLPPGGLAGLTYPEPDEPHPAGDAAMARKIAAARAATGAPVLAFAHGYGPVDDVARRARVAWEASGRRMWINRYGYLSDEKLARLGAIVEG